MADDEKRWDLTLTKKEMAASVWYEIVDLLKPLVRAYLWFLAFCAVAFVILLLVLGAQTFYHSLGF